MQKTLLLLTIFLIASTYPSNKTRYFGDIGYRKVKNHLIIYPSPGRKIYKKLNSDKRVFSLVNGILYCLNAKDGKIAWKFNAGDITNIDELLNHGDKVYVARPDGWIFSLNAKDGKIVWKIFSNEEYYPVPVLKDNLIYLSGEGQNLYIINPQTGEIERRIYNAGTMHPVSFLDNYLLIPSHEKLFLYQKNDGKYKKVWSIPVYNRYHHTPLITSSGIFFGSEDKKIYLLNIKDGKVAWKYTTFGKISAALFVDDKYVYAGSFDGNLYALNVSTGKKKYSIKVNAPITAGILSKGNNLYFATEAGFVYCIDKNRGFTKWKYLFGSKDISSLYFVDDALAVSGKNKGISLISSYSGRPYWEFNPGLKLSETEADGNYIYYTQLKGNVITKYNIKLKETVWKKIMPDTTLYKPFVLAKDIFYFTKDHLYILDKISSKIKSRHNLRMECEYPVIYKNHVCASYSDRVYNYNIIRRRYDWIKNISGTVNKGMVLDNWKLIFATKEGVIYSLQTKRGILEFETNIKSAANSLPTVYADTIYIGASNDKFYAINKLNGKILWSFKTFGSISSSAAISRKNIYFASEAHFIYCFGRVSGKKIWNSSIRTKFITSPVIFGDYLILAGNTGEVYFVLKKSGDLRGSYFTGSGVLGEIKIHDKKIIFTSNAGVIYILANKALSR